MGSVLVLCIYSITQEGYLSSLLCSTRFFAFFSFTIFGGGDSTTTRKNLKSEVADDGNREEVADSVASQQARIGNRELESN